MIVLVTKKKGLVMIDMEMKTLNKIIHNITLNIKMFHQM